MVFVARFNAIQEYKSVIVHCMDGSKGFGETALAIKYYCNCQQCCMSQALLIRALYKNVCKLAVLQLVVQHVSCLAYSLQGGGTTAGLHHTIGNINVSAAEHKLALNITFLYPTYFLPNVF